MHGDIDQKVQKLFKQAKPKELDPEPKKKNRRPIFFLFFLTATLILLFQTVTVTPQPNNYYSNTVNYSRSPYGQALRPANYPIEIFNCVGCAHFKRKPAAAADKYQKMI